VVRDSPPRPLGIYIEGKSHQHLRLAGARLLKTIFQMPFKKKPDQALLDQLEFTIGSPAPWKIAGPPAGFAQLAQPAPV